MTATFAVARVVWAGKPSPPVVWRDREIHLMNGMGRVIWAVAFAVPLTRVVAAGDRLVCAAAGVLAAFSRAG